MRERGSFCADQLVEVPVDVAPRPLE